MHSDRIFEYLRQSDYTKMDGSAGSLAIWRGSCRDCGAPFEISTPPTANSIASSKAFARVHCDVHKKAVTRISPKQNQKGSPNEID